MADRERVRWHLTQAKRNALDTIDGRARLGKDWAADPVTKAGITKLVEISAPLVASTVRSAARAPVSFAFALASA